MKSVPIRVVLGR